ncbi:MAG: phosphatidate cytidylyltransferase [Acidothermus sp.]|nr:phosphatidate cytidylyltransferase [Acidothermus sp.]
MPGARRTGRNLGAATVVGVLLAAVVLAALFVDVRVFSALVAVAVVAAITEFAVALRTAHVGHVPAVALAGAGYIAGCAAFAVLLADRRPAYVAAVLAVVVANDVGGYAVGVLVGRHPLAPRVSPKKSWEGLAGSLATGTAVGVGVGVLVLDRVWWEAAVGSVLLVMAATAGDLVESWVKRRIGVKDMSRLLPGHGGLLDRIDSILLAMPVAWVLLVLG